MGRTRGVAVRVTLCMLIVAVFSFSSESSAVAIADEQPGVHNATTPTEFQIMRFYRAILDREPDADGMAYWHRLLTTGTDLTTIADSFATSIEFEQRFGVPQGAAGDLRFLEQVYRNVLGRQPDAEGKRYWSQLLEAGVPRAQVVLWFSESAEFITATGLGPAQLAPFEGSIVPVTAADLGVSWREGCPVPPSDLRLVRASHVDFSGQSRDGELVVHADQATDVLVVLQRLYEQRYPIQSMRTIDEFDGSDDASMEANNTSGFNCRSAVGGSAWSQHAYGRAIDINPLVNPYVKGSVILPPTGARFVDRLTHNPSLIREGDIVVRSFDAIGWQWGGRWRTVKDYQHFSLSGR
ncbi:MAG: DUF4214 domain-containing protein [Acidimicrobiales bacterium]